MFNVLFISKNGAGLDLAYKLVKEGSRVRVFIEDKEEKELFDGFPIEKIRDYHSSIRWADFVIFDDNDLEPIKRVVNLYNKPTFGIAKKREINFLGKRFYGYAFGEALEQDRGYGKKLFEHFKIGNKLETKEFKNVEEAKKYLLEHSGPFVIKPESDDQVESSLTLVGEMINNEDAILYLDSLIERPDAKRIKKIEIEKRVRGVEIACSVWFNGKDFLDRVNINFEHKKFATGNSLFPEGLGFNTGEQGTMMIYQDLDNKLFRETIYKMGDWLKDIGFRGIIDINTIVNEDGLFPLEFTPSRFGYPTIYIMQELHKTAWTNLLGSIALGLDIKLETYDDWAIGVVCNGEGYPNSELARKNMAYLPIIGWEDYEDHIHFCEVKKKKDIVFCYGGYVFTATDKGKDIEEAREKVYNTLGNVYFPKMFYRTDIGVNLLENQLKEVIKWGYLKL